MNLSGVKKVSEDWANTTGGYASHIRASRFILYQKLKRFKAELNSAMKKKITLVIDDFINFILAVLISAAAWS